MLTKSACGLLIAGFAVGASAQTTPPIQANKPYSAYAQEFGGTIVRSTFGLCWRTGFWTPEDAVIGCDGVLAPPVVKSIAPAFVAKPDPTPTSPVAVPTIAPIAAATPIGVEKPAPAPALISEKVSLAGGALFDSGKADLKPAGKTKLDELASKLKGINLDAVIATGHTDSMGSAESNMKLSLKRADAVKTYLTSKGVDAKRIRAEGQGEAQPVADNKTVAGRDKNRRVEIEIVGTRIK